MSLPLFFMVVLPGALMLFGLACLFLAGLHLHRSRNEDDWGWWLESVTGPYRTDLYWNWGYTPWRFLPRWHRKGWRVQGVFWLRFTLITPFRWRKK